MSQDQTEDEPNSYMQDILDMLHCLIYNPYNIPTFSVTYTLIPQE